MWRRRSGSDVRLPVLRGKEAWCAAACIPRHSRGMGIAGRIACKEGETHCVRWVQGRAARDGYFFGALISSETGRWLSLPESFSALSFSVLKNVNRG